MRHPYGWAKVLLLLLLPATAMGVVAAGRSIGIYGGISSFDTLDSDADGFISRDEADADKTISLLFGVADGDGDNRLSREEHRVIIVGAATVAAGGLRG